jgi:hypothetical protein
MKERLVSFGLTNIIGDEIFINRSLLKEKDLFKQAILHEQKHLSGDKKADWNEHFDRKMWGFIFKHPSTWVQFLPIWIYEGKIIYSKTLMKIWIFAIWLFILGVSIIYA